MDTRCPQTRYPHQFVVSVFIIYSFSGGAAKVDFGFPSG